jgi:antitoxin YefM
MEKIDEYIPITKAKNQILNTIREIVALDSTVAITKNGLPQAVLMSMDHYTALQETIEILADSEIMEQLRSSSQEMHNKEQLMDLDEL